MDGGAWWAVVHEVEKSQTQLSDFILIFIQSEVSQKEKHQYSILMHICGI